MSLRTVELFFSEHPRLQLSSHAARGFTGRKLVSTGLEGNHFRRFSGIQFGPGASGRQHNALSPQQAPPLVAEFFLHATQPGLEQATTLRRTQQERQWWSTAHAVAIAGRPHVRVVVARSVPEIQSAGEPKRIATSIFAALRQREHVHKSAPHWLSADSSPMASRMTVRDFGGLGQGPVTPGLSTEILNQHDVAGIYIHLAEENPAAIGEHC